VQNLRIFSNEFTRRCSPKDEFIVKPNNLLPVDVLKLEDTRFKFLFRAEHIINVCHYSDGFTRIVDSDEETYSIELRSFGMSRTGPQIGSFKNMISFRGLIDSAVSGARGFFSGFASIFSGTQAFADDSQLDVKQDQLTTANNYKPEGEKASSIRRQPVQKSSGSDPHTLFAGTCSSATSCNLKRLPHHRITQLCVGYLNPPKISRKRNFSFINIHRSPRQRCPHWRGCFST
jgi:hypothetical protein